MTARRALQDRLSELNPDSGDRPDLQHAELRPDGDAVVEDWHDFVLADCERCGGVLKPDVVFFGESVPKPRVEQAYHLVDSAEVLVVLGSSLTVMSGLRFVRHAARQERPSVIINRGTTRGDELAALKLEVGCSEVLTRAGGAPALGWEPWPRRQNPSVEQAAEGVADAAADLAEAVADPAHHVAGAAHQLAGAVPRPSPIPPKGLPNPPNSMLPIRTPESMSLPLQRL